MNASGANRRPKVERHEIVFGEFSLLFTLFAVQRQPQQLNLQMNIICSCSESSLALAIIRSLVDFAAVSNAWFAIGAEKILRTFVAAEHLINDLRHKKRWHLMQIETRGKAYLKPNSNEFRVIRC